MPCRIRAVAARLDAEALAMTAPAPQPAVPRVVDPPASYEIGPQEIGEEEIALVTEALRSRRLFRFNRAEDDSYVGRFERAFGACTGTTHALAVNSGTSALICGLVGLGVSSGDEVIVPAYTYVATAAAVLALRAFPVIAEIDASLTIDPADIERKITPRTRAIIPVHMRGVPCRMDEIRAIARRHGLRVLEDCAQANGGSFRGRALGSLGDAGAFSMQQFKIITAGEGGAMTTSDSTVFERAACWHDAAYAMWQKLAGRPTGIPPFLGENYRMSELNGALVLAQLAKRGRILARLRAIKRRFHAGVDGLPGIRLQDIPDPEGDCGTSLVFFAGDAGRAKDIAAALRGRGMSAGSLFDKGIPDRHVYYHWDYIMERRTPDAYGSPWTDRERPCQVDYRPGMCPRTDDLLARTVSIPFTQVMSDVHVDSCIAAVRQVVGEG
jgi:8-amino-3,8-dideoxy-alpha-D-manno-octulosonate transaminase